MTNLIRVLVTLPMHSWTQTPLQENLTPPLKSEHSLDRYSLSLSGNESVSEDDTLTQQPLVTTASHQSEFSHRPYKSLHLLDIRKCCLMSITEGV